MTWILVAIVLALIAIPVVIEGNRTVMNDLTRDTAPGSFATLSQGVTHYQWFGPSRGPVIVCVHGLTSPSFVWARLVRGLALMGFRVLTYDHYGRGFSDRVKGPQDRAFFLQQLGDLLTHQNVDGDRVTLLGYSMGGAIATLYAADNPTRVARLILLAPAGMGVIARGPLRFITRTKVIGDWIMLAFYPSQLRAGIRAEGDADMGARQEKELDYKGFVPAVLASLRGVLSERLEEDHRIVHRYDVPVMAIWGEKDTVIPLSAMGTLAQWSRKARQEVIPDAGHGLTYTHPDTVLAFIQDFVAET